MQLEKNLNNYQDIKFYKENLNFQLKKKIKTTYFVNVELKKRR